MHFIDKNMNILKNESSFAASSTIMNQMTHPSIVIVEDDPEIGDLVARYLRGQDMEVMHALDGKAMDAILSSKKIDLIILDINLPGEDGLSICRRLRVETRIPIIMLTARNDDIDKILGLEIGADDYLVKPFNPRELLARIRAVLRRVESHSSENQRNIIRQLIRFSGWSLDLLSREVTSPDGTKIAVTGAEFDLLHAFCENPRRILTREHLISLTHGVLSDSFERSVDVLVSRLRQKLQVQGEKSAFIQTVRSEGYMFVADVIKE
jgi:two-component system OmpR family response regulator